MAMRKPKPPAGPGHDWYLQQWMKTLRVRQAQLGERCGWGKSKTNDVYHGRTIYTRDIVNEVADALNLHPWELLMHPDDAMAVRRMTAALRRVEVSENLHELGDEPRRAAVNER
jgi:transcriptional regulator with XRE-family HTH domain